MIHVCLAVKTLFTLLPPLLDAHSGHPYPMKSRVHPQMLAKARMFRTGIAQGFRHKYIQQMMSKNHLPKFCILGEIFGNIFCRNHSKSAAFRAKSVGFD